MFDEGGRERAADDVGQAAHVGEPWQELDRQVRRLARRRAALDAEEARLLVAARAAEVHRHLGYGSFDEYLERALGYAPTTARDRMRVATALESLPLVREALAAGTICFSAVREITRVATPATERAWLDAIAGLTAREVEDCVRGHAPGDHPDDRPDPRREPRAVRLELQPEVYALFLAARRALEGDVGHAMTDSDFMGAACRAVLAGGAAADDGAVAATPVSTTNTPPHQIALTVCEACRRGWQHAPGRAVEVPAASIERARCDATLLGRVDGPAPDVAQRSIPAAIRRMVLARDHHRCQVPGCRSTRFVDVHHLDPRARGGDHRPLNLLTLCSVHHDHVHTGRIVLAGTAGALRVTHADGRPYGAPPPPPARAPRTTPPVARGPTAAAPPSSTAVADARSALVSLGFRPPEAAAAVAHAAAHVGDVPLPTLIREALRACHRGAG